MTRIDQSSDNRTIAQVWIIGSGRFGLRAARFLRKDNSRKMDVTLVDREGKVLKKPVPRGDFRRRCHIIFLFGPTEKLSESVR